MGAYDPLASNFAAEDRDHLALARAGGVENEEVPLAQDEDVDFAGVLLVGSRGQRWCPLRAASGGKRSSEAQRRKPLRVRDRSERNVSCGAEMQRREEGTAAP